MKGFESKNIVEVNQTQTPTFNNQTQCNIDVLFFIKIVRDWNSLEEATVCPDSVGGLDTSLHSSD